MPNVGPMEIGLVLIIALIVFGPKKLPDLGRSLGKGIREFKGSISGEGQPEVPTPPAAVGPPPVVQREHAEAKPVVKTPV
jgi:sec-independent protein translocase protein TatA